MALDILKVCYQCHDDEILVEKEDEGFINVKIFNPNFFTKKKKVGYLKVNEVK